MHQQVRTTLTKSGGPGAMEGVYERRDPYRARPGALLELLRLLADNGYNLTAAGGSRIEMGGKFVFSIHHEEGDNRTGECADLVAANGYRGVETVTPHVCELDDERGALAECLGQLEAEGRLIHEVQVLTPNSRGKIPVHITTVQQVEGRARA